MTEHNDTDLSDYWFELILGERVLMLKTDNEWSEDDFYQHYEAKLMATPHDGETLPPVEAGKLSFYILRVNQAITNGENLFSCFDSISGDVLSCWEALYQSRGYDLKPSVQKLLDWPMSSNLLYFEHLEVYPPFRGMKLGLAMLRTLMEEYSSSCGLAVLIPMPMESRRNRQTEDERHENWPRPLTPQEKKAAERLGKYYARLGFKRIPRSNVYAFNLSYKLP